MRQNLITILKELKEIRPNSDYSKRSRALILLEIETDKKAAVAPKFKFADFFGSFYANKLAFSAVSAVILLLIISGSVYYIKNQSNQSDLVARASEANASIQVKLNEIQYLIKNPGQLGADRILIIQALLQKAADDLREAANSEPQNLDKSLEKIKIVQEMLYQMNGSNENK